MDRLGNIWNSKTDGQVNFYILDVTPILISVALCWLILEIQKRQNSSALDVRWKIVKNGNNRFTDENEEGKQTLRRCVSLVEDTCREYKALLDMIYTKTATASRTILPSTTLNSAFALRSSAAMLNGLRVKNSYENMCSRVYSNADKGSFGPIKSTATMNKSRRSSASSNSHMATVISEKNEEGNNIRDLRESSKPCLHFGKNSSGRISTKKSVRLIDSYKLHRCNSLASLIESDAGCSNRLLHI